MSGLGAANNVANNSANNQQQDQVDKKDFLDRVDTLCAMGHNVLISHFPLFAQLHVELRRFTEDFIVMAIGATTLAPLFEAKNYAKFPGGIMAAFGHLFDRNSRVYVFPYKTEQSCLTAHSFNPDPSLAHFYRHLLENRFVVDIENCDDVDTSLMSVAVGKLLAAGNPKWEELVPPNVRDLIKKRKLFGYNGR
jgi:hypothetical protein